MFNDMTNEQVSLAREKAANGKRLTKADKLLLRMSDGAWHDAADLAYNISWRFGGYLFELKKRGVEWEKERIVGTAERVYRYRLSPRNEG